jgi:hypothetical protein
MASVVLVGLLAGCGERTLPQSQTYPVHGRILVHKKPGSFVLVRFEPVEGGAGVAAAGKTNADGDFELRTYSNAENDGAVPGEYKVIIEGWDPVENGPLPRDAKAVVLPKAMQASQTYTIEAAPTELTIDIDQIAEGGGQPR